MDLLASSLGMTLELARRIAAAAEKEAKDNGWAVAITVLDEGGNQVWFQKLDGTQIGSIRVSQNKAWSAFAFKRPTVAFEEAYKAGRTQILALEGAVPVEGGVPLLYKGQVVGAIGVSGVTSAQDGQVARAGAAVLTALEAAA